MRPAALICLSALITLSGGCATRQVTDQLGGSSAQRLVSYSIERWINDLPDEDFAALKGKTVRLQTRFVEKSPALDYTHDLLELSLSERFDLRTNLQEEETADYELTFFFNSLGTDSDHLGVSIPFIDVSGGGESSRIDLLALDMYHGIAEGFYVIKDMESGIITRHDKHLARVRTDSLSTPIVKIPISNMK